MSAAALISTHLNAPYGAVVTESEVLDSIRNGCLAGRSEQANALLGNMFVEVEPRLIARCALEAKTTIQQAQLLYLDTLAHAHPRCRQWESAVEHLL